jgi:hypothetical protein
MLNFAFFLGVVFITFNMLWSFFTFFLRAFIGELGSTEKYLLRLTQAYFMASMTAKATLQFNENNATQGNILLATGIIVLFLYLISKIEQRKKMIQFNLQLNKNNVTFSKQHLKYDIVIAVLTVAFYIFSVFNTPLIDNAANTWFFTSIQKLYTAPIIGWIIGLVGIFFIIGIFIKGIASFQIIYNQFISFFNKDKRDDNDDDFSDFDYVEDDDNLIE